MERVYFWCAAVGGAILAVQLLFTLIGAGHADVDVDVDLDHGHLDGSAGDPFFKVLSLKTVVAFVTFFGLAGLAAGQAGLARGTTLLVAVAAGSAALYVVAWIMAGLVKLHASGNVDLENAIGTCGRVYLRVPARHGGRGKVTLTVQGRTVEAPAVTSGDTIETGRTVRVVGVTGAETLDVVAAD